MIGSPSAAAKPGAPAQLTIDRIVKRYSAGVTIGPISLDVRPGEFFSLLGPSGCGKTTILRCIAGFEELSEGRIELGSAALHTKPAHRRNIGLVFQSYALFPHLTLFENVAFGLRIRRVARDEMTSRVEAALDLVGLPGLERRYPAQLSGGQQQRAAIARAVVLEPALILFDEPLSNLDQKLRVQLRFELRKLQRRIGMTSIFVTHDQSEALALSDRIAVLSHGKVEQVGTPSDIYERPASTFVADFIGNANIFDCDVVGREGGAVHVRLSDGTVLRASGGGQAEARAAAKVLVRPEHIRLVAPGAAASGENALDLLVEDVTYLGDALHLRLGREGATSWLAAVGGAEAHLPLCAGAPVTVTMSPHHVYLLQA